MKKKAKRRTKEPLSTKDIKSKEPKETVSFDALMRNIMSVKPDKK